MNETFVRFARNAAHAAGSAWTFILAAGVVAVWAAFGPLTGFSSTWQLVINTGTTIVTFLMVFLVQNTQNRDSAALHLKLNELIQAVNNARPALVDIEDATDAEVKRFQQEFAELRALAASDIDEALEAVTAHHNDNHEMDQLDAGVSR